MYPSALLQLLSDSVNDAPLHHETLTMLSGCLDMQACTEVRPTGLYLRGLFDSARGDIDVWIDVVGDGLRLVVTEHVAVGNRRGRLVWNGPVVKESRVVLSFPVDRVGVLQ